MRIAASIYAFVISRTDARRNSQCLPPRAVGSDTTDATCLSAHPDATQRAEQHVDKVCAMARQRSSSQSRTRPNDARSGCF
jgi:hypothetical protein